MVTSPSAPIDPMPSESFSPTTLEQSILATLSFFALFRHPLTLEELTANLLKIHPSASRHSRTGGNPETRMPEKDLDGQLNALLADGRLITSNNLYALPGHEADCELRVRRAPILEKRLARVRRYAPLLRHVPFVRGAYLCNNLSFGIATEKGDIDLLIVTAPGHIFTARFLATAFFHLLGIRRHGSETTDRFCLSFYVTEDNLDFSTFKLDPQDIYLAYWTRHLVPCFPSPVTGKISEKNRRWLQDYFPMVEYGEENIKQKDGNAPLSPQAIKGGQGAFVQCLLEPLLTSRTGRWIADRLSTYQKRKLTSSSSSLPDPSGTIISDAMLKFHDRDRRREYQAHWTQRNHERS